MRQAVAVLLLLSLIAGQVRMIGALVGRYQAQQQMQEQIEAASQSIEEERVQHLTIARAERQSPTSSFVQVEEREFRYEGKLYDIVRAEWRGDVWHVWAVHDRAEEHYLEVLDGAAETRVGEGSAVPADQRLPVLRPLALLPTPGTLPSPPSERARHFPPFSFAELPSPTLEVPHPPPWG